MNFLSLNASATFQTLLNFFLTLIFLSLSKKNSPKYFTKSKTWIIWVISTKTNLPFYQSLNNVIAFVVTQGIFRVDIPLTLEFIDSLNYKFEAFSPEKRTSRKGGKSRNRNFIKSRYSVMSAYKHLFIYIFFFSGIKSLIRDDHHVPVMRGL